MVFGIGLIVNAVLVAIPVGGSVGALMGIDAHRSATGQKPLFTGGNTEDGTTPGGGSTGDGGDHHTTTPVHGTQMTEYCDLSWGITPPSKTEQYTLNPNQWGVTDTTVGKLCMNVTTFKNETYPTNTAPEFSVNWKFDAGPETQPVHAYSNIRVDDVLPLALDSMQQLYLDLHWTYGSGNASVETTSSDDLKAANLNTNVAIDMFLDSDKTKAENGTNAAYEVMVWFAQIGAATQPIGLQNKSKATRNLNGTNFELYAGQNGQGQNVMSWVSEEAVNGGFTERFAGDIYPLITDLYSMTSADLNDIEPPSKDDFLGSLAFGTEAFYSGEFVTFSVPEYKIDIRT
ncbi:hypothetical protein PENANT_c031G10030 [Penicillium antarcticum]|uniref:xyloglucan-specific endo-beta-1,4-glucanase n=1 Tax=Penicillium antarcticum TaxID=416450 RepID=A0A1V6PV37_9EURO|nr:uncharacterized protein N7508_005539 [Penicillium antarcticum]KAJ5306524.1 hypothetical protein N7508_005539 [Penicillium antarcticum]OQD80899.1 hypothetical protein PENANT_c031G10030 [Penicillium antarcticum]